MWGNAKCDDGVEVTSDNVFIVVQKIFEKGGTIMVVYVSCCGSGWYITVGDVERGISVYFCNDCFCLFMVRCGNFCEVD